MSGREIVTTALELLRANYVFPEVAERAATAVEARLAAGEYDDLDERALAELLTGHLNEICDDKHLRVRARGPRSRRPGPGGPGPRRPDGRGRSRSAGPVREEPDDHEARVLAMRRMGRLDNFGIHRVERLDGNIGYLDLRRVPSPAIAGPAMAAAMELVAGTYALIIDLRRNGGGAPDGVVFWCSYLFDEQPTHLNDIFRADTGETRQFWALPYVPGPRYLDRPVYVLSSDRTFSGGEDFAYTLQALGRAEVIGETTGGGAHPTRMFPISRAVHIGVPFARSVNPVTGANWQGTGVVPDLAVPEAEARDVAYAKALRHVLDAAGRAPADRGRGPRGAGRAAGRPVTAAGGPPAVGASRLAQRVDDQHRQRHRGEQQVGAQRPAPVAVGQLAGQHPAEHDGLHPAAGDADGGHPQPRDDRGAAGQVDAAERGRHRQVAALEQAEPGELVEPGQADPGPGQPRDRRRQRFQQQQDGQHDRKHEHRCTSSIGSVPGASGKA